MTRIPRKIRPSEEWKTLDFTKKPSGRKKGHQEAVAWWGEGKRVWRGAWVGEDSAR
jgi:hypothetical protein